MAPVTLAHLLAALLLAGRAGEAAGSSPPALPWIHCTPATLTFPGGEVLQAGNSIAEALARAGPATVVLLDPGDYPPFTIGFDSDAPDNARTAGGTPLGPIVVQGGPGVRVRTRGGDTIAIHQDVPCANILFRGLEIEPGDRSALMFYRQPPGRVHAGFTFEDCDVVGSYDPIARSGAPSKWGVWAHSLRDFRFAGVRRPARVENLRYEHAFYLQNPRGSVTIENVRARFLGRTFVQVTARAADGAPGEGTLVVRDCDVEDVGLAAEDGYKGGSAFTVAGRLAGTLLFERNRYRAGFTPGVAALTLPGEPHATGAFVAWQAGEEVPNGTLILRDNDFETAAGSGDRPLVTIGGCREVLILGANRFVSGGAHAALALDPANERGELGSSPNGSVFLAPRTELAGGVTLRGEPAAERDLEALRRAR